MTDLAHTHRTPFGTRASVSHIAPAMAYQGEVEAKWTVGIDNGRFTADIHALVARRAL